MNDDKEVAFDVLYPRGTCFLAESLALPPDASEVILGLTVTDDGRRYRLTEHDPFPPFFLQNLSFSLLTRRK